MSEWIAAAEILDRARERVEENGWQQGALAPVDEECVATALEHAMRETGRSVVEFNYAREALSRHLEIAREPEDNGALPVPYWGKSLMDWNDAPGRTKADVLAAIDGAAGLARSLA